MSVQIISEDREKILPSGLSIRALNLDQGGPEDLAFFQQLNEHLKNSLPPEHRNKISNSPRVLIMQGEGCKQIASGISNLLHDTASSLRAADNIFGNYGYSEQDVTYHGIESAIIIQSNEPGRPLESVRSATITRVNQTMELLKLGIKIPQDTFKY